MKTSRVFSKPNRSQGKVVTLLSRRPVQALTLPSKVTPACHCDPAQSGVANGTYIALHFIYELVLFIAGGTPPFPPL